jgi:dCTP deaminase
MILPDWMIRELVIIGEFVYVPKERQALYGDDIRSQIQPASLDVRLAGEFRDYVTGETIWSGLKPGDHLALDPGECILGSLVEAFRIPDIVARVEGKSSWARKFLTVHSAGFIDPGFIGDITLELKNDGYAPLYIPVGCAIAQVSFHQMAAPADRPYGSAGLNSHYQNQCGPTKSAL